MQTLKIRIAGTAPLLLHNGQLANPLNHIVKQIKELTGKGKKKTDDDIEAIMRLEFEGGMYFDDKLGPFVPSINIESCIRGGATFQRKGMDIVRGVYILEDKVKIEYKGPRTLDALYDGKFYDVRGVVVNGNRTMRCRPKFDEWALVFTASVNAEIMNPPELLGHVNTAGSFVGLGDFTPRFGRFDAELVE